MRLDEMPVAVAGASAPEPLDRTHVLTTLARSADRTGAVLQAVDARAVCGRDHLVHAARLAARAIHRDDTIADDPGVEVALWLAGDDQITRALSTVGVPDPCEALGLVAIGAGAEAAIDDAMAALGLDRDDAVLVAGVDALARLGVPVVPGADPTSLAMEHSALLATRT